MKTRLRIPRFLFAALSLFVVAILATGCDSTDVINEPEPTALGRSGDGNLNKILESVRSRNDLPALAALLVRGGAVVEADAVGLRALGYPEAVTVEDRWHVGSITKSMTATLAGVLVEQGVIAWEITLAEAFPDLTGTMRAAYADVRLDELLSNTSGMGGVSDAAFWDTSFDPAAPVAVQCRLLTAELLTMAPAAARGTYQYSNAGYIVAGAMLEAVTGQSWEALMQTHLFGPLGMTSTGFGAPGSAGRRDEPLGHVPDGASWQSLDPAHLEADLPAVIGPAGTVHTTLADAARYMAAHLAGAQGIDGLVSAQTFAKLHQAAPGTAYALGWNVSNGVLLHDGSNERWLAWMIIAPERDEAVFAVTNCADETKAAKGIDDALTALYERARAAFGQ